MCKRMLCKNSIHAVNQKFAVLYPGTTGFELLTLHPLWVTHRLACWRPMASCLSTKKPEVNSICSPKDHDQRVASRRPWAPTNLSTIGKVVCHGPAVHKHTCTKQVCCKHS